MQLALSLHGRPWIASALRARRRPYRFTSRWRPDDQLPAELAEELVVGGFLRVYAAQEWAQCDKLMAQLRGLRTSLHSLRVVCCTGRRPAWVAFQS